MKILLLLLSMNANAAYIHSAFNQVPIGFEFQHIHLGIPGKFVRESLKVVLPGYNLATNTLLVHTIVNGEGIAIACPERVFPVIRPENTQSVVAFIRAEPSWQEFYEGRFTSRISGRMAETLNWGLKSGDFDKIEQAFQIIRGIVRDRWKK